MGAVTVLRATRYWVDDEGIIRGVLITPEFTLADAVEMMEMHRTLTAGKPRCLLMNITAVRALAREVRSYFGDPEHATIHKAVALVVGSPLSRAVGNFFLGLNKPAVPMRLFSDEESAVNWLRPLAHKG